MSVKRGTGVYFFFECRFGVKVRVDTNPNPSPYLKTAFLKKKVEVRTFFVNLFQYFFLLSSFFLYSSFCFVATFAAIFSDRLSNFT